MHEFGALVQGVQCLLCILTSFWVVQAPKSWSNYFFQPFSTFFVLFKPFSVILCLRSTVWSSLLCILTSFWVLRSPESWSNYFFPPFSTFFVKKVLQPTFGCVQHLKAGWNTQHKLELILSWLSYLHRQAAVCPSTKNPI